MLSGRFPAGLGLSGQTGCDGDARKPSCLFQAAVQWEPNAPRASCSADDHRYQIWWGLTCAIYHSVCVGWGLAVWAEAPPFSRLHLLPPNRHHSGRACLVCMTRTPCKTGNVCDYMNPRKTPSHPKPAHPVPHVGGIFAKNVMHTWVLCALGLVRASCFPPVSGLCALPAPPGALWTPLPGSWGHSAVVPCFPGWCFLATQFPRQHSQLGCRARTWGPKMNCCHSAAFLPALLPQAGSPGAMLAQAGVQGRVLAPACPAVFVGTHEAVPGKPVLGRVGGRLEPSACLF